MAVFPIPLLIGTLFMAGRLLVMAAVVLMAESVRAAEAPIGQIIGNFALQDFHGKAHSLSDYDAGKMIVVAFIGVECPLANLYAPRLVELAKNYEPRSVAFLAIDSNRQDSNGELAAYASRHEIFFPVLRDPGNVIADRFGAERTPQVFLLDRERKVRYCGRIDDQFAVGIQRSAATERDLAAALDELLTGKEITKPLTDAPGCFIGRVQIGRQRDRVEKSADAVTWSKDIARIVQQRCQECHRPDQLAPFSLLSYEDAIGWAETIREVVALDRMPPWNPNPKYGRFANELRLSAEEKSKILAWVDAGAPEGDPKESPAPREFTPGWRIPQPDQIVYMAKKPFRVKAEGVVEYQWFYVDPGFQQDRWVHAIEARPGCKAVVHHITIYFKPPGGKWDMRHNTQINLLGGFNPGGEPLVLPPGTAIRLPAGTEFAFEMHYTPSGVAQLDRSFVGLCFADPKSIRKELRSYMPADTQLKIPPEDADFVSQVRYRFKDDMDLLVMRPHMHLRGKAFRYEALYPDGTKEILLDVPRFDFNWQHSYYLAKPKRLPRGTELNCIAHFDNSAGNPFNPDSTKTVRWGDQSWDEMMIGIFCAVMADEDLQTNSMATRRPAGLDNRLLIAAVLLACGLALAVYLSRRGRRVTG